MSKEPAVAPAHHEMGALAFAWRALGWYRPFIASASFVILGILFELGFTATVPLATRAAIDRAIIPHDARLLLFIAGGLAIGAVTVSVIAVLAESRYARINTAVLNRLRLRLFNHVQRLSASYFSRGSGSEVSARFSTDLAAIEWALESLVSWAILPLLDAVIATLVLLALDWRLALGAQLIWPLALLFPRLVTPHAAMAAGRMKEAEAQILSSVQEMTDGHAVIEAYGLGRRSTRRFRLRLATLRASAVRVRFLSSLSERSASGGFLALQAIMLGAGGLVVIRGELSLGTLVAFQSFFAALSYSIGYLVHFLSSLLQAGAGLERIERTLAEVPSVGDAPGAITLAPFARAFELEGVCFEHEKGRRALDNVSFRVARGERVAIVGASGSGKSTLLCLLARIHDPTAGTLRIDGHDLRTVTRESLTSQVAIVFQDSFLFDTTIRENIRLGNLAATEEEIVEAARAAELHDFVARLPLGYETPVGERGARLSGGQRQRIAIARALVRRPAILLLDEPGSALDEPTRAAIRSTLRRLGEGRTIITATHEREAGEDADRIIVLEGGRVVRSE